MYFLSFELLSLWCTIYIVLMSILYLFQEFILVLLVLKFVIFRRLVKVGVAPYIQTIVGAIKVNFALKLAYIHSVKVKILTHNIMKQLNRMSPL